MDLVTHEILASLTRPRKNIGVSILMPFNDGSDGDQKNPALLKELLGSSAVELTKTAIKPDMIEQLLKPGYELVKNETYWRDRFETLAVYLFDGEVSVYKLPFFTEQKIIVSRYPYLKPIIKDFVSNKRLYVLVLEAGGSRLFKFDKYNYLEITPKSLEQSSKEYADYFQIERETNYHIKKEGSLRGKEGIISHGHDNTGQLDKLRATEYARMVAKEVKKISNVESLPLVIAGIKSGFLAPVFRSVYDGAGLVDDYVQVETAPLDLDTLQTEVRRIVETLETQAENDNLETVTRLFGTGLEENIPDEIVKRSFEGRVDTLFVNNEKDAFGVMNVFNDTCEVSLTDNPEDEDLTNMAIVNTWGKKGKVFFASDKVLQGKSLMASLRY